MIKIGLFFKSQSGRRKLKREPAELVLPLAGDNTFNIALSRIEASLKTGKVFDFDEARCTEVRRSGAPPALVFRQGACRYLREARTGVRAPFLCPDRVWLLKDYRAL
jgi:hypothetical protein